MLCEFMLELMLDLCWEFMLCEFMQNLCRIYAGDLRRRQGAADLASPISADPSEMRPGESGLKSWAGRKASGQIGRQGKNKPRNFEHMNH